MGCERPAVNSRCKTELSGQAQGSRLVIDTGGVCPLNGDREDGSRSQAVDLVKMTTACVRVWTVDSVAQGMEVASMPTDVHPLYKNVCVGTCAHTHTNTHTPHIYFSPSGCAIFIKIKRGCGCRDRPARGRGRGERM